LVLLAPLHNTAQDLRVSMVQEVCVWTLVWMLLSNRISGELHRPRRL
jgi:hypothetical protein